MRSGDPLTQIVEYAEGFPDGNVTWILRNDSGATVTTGVITPLAGDLSSVVTVSGVSNTLGAGELFAERELSWSYTVGGAQQQGHLRYRVEAFLGFGVSPEGVRSKLGVEPHELDDDEINLVFAYALFEKTVTTATLISTTDPLARLLVHDAIEALAALRSLPTLQVKIAAKEVSGVSQFQRGTIKWDTIEAQLNDMVAAGYTALVPTFDGAASFGSAFLVVTRTPDPVTGV